MTLFCKLCQSKATHIWVTDSNPPIMTVCLPCGAKQKGINLSEEEKKMLSELSEGVLV